MDTRNPPSSRQLPLPICLTLSVLTVGCVADFEGELDERGGRAGATVTICHVPPGHPANPQTIEVAPAAVAKHLDRHGDALGPCPPTCLDLCDELTWAFEDFCLGIPALPGLPDDLCESGVEIIGSACAAVCPTPTPEGCLDFCAGVVAESVQGCLELGVPGFICGIAADVTTNHCWDVFDCPPPPPTCHDACFAAYDQALQACEQDGDPACWGQADDGLRLCEQSCCVADCAEDCSSQCGDEPVCVEGCEESCIVGCQPPSPSCLDLCVDEANAGYAGCIEAGPDPSLPCADASTEQGCFVVWQSFLNECAFGPGRCIDPGVDCFSGCQNAANDVLLACASEPQCQDPLVCQQEAEILQSECTAGCEPGPGPEPTP